MQFFDGEPSDRGWGSGISKKYEEAFNKLIKERKIFLAEEVTCNTASIIVAILFMLDAEDSKAPITLYINSVGGEVEACFALYDAIHIIKAPVRTVCIGQACSTAAILLAAGEQGMRAATPNSRIMIHQMYIEGEVDGKATDIEVEAKEIKNTKKRMTETLARHTGQTYRKVYRDCEIDKWFSAEEAKEYGIIDEILPLTKKVPELKTRKSPRHNKKQ